VANANDNLTTSFTESSSPETFLDRDLGDLEAPRVLNRRPTDIDGSGNPPGFTAIGEYMGRLFAIAPRRSRCFFSAALEDTNNGRVEECWPQEYSFRVTEPKGILDVATGSDSDQVIIHTASGDRVVVGYDPLSFRTERAGTRRVEGFQGGAVNVGGSLVELHRDKRIMDYGYANSLLQPRRFGGKDIGQPIQDKLKACSAANFTKSRVHWFSYATRDFLFVSVPSTSGSSVNDATFVYDYDLDNWYQWGIGFSAFLTVHNTTTGELELWGGTPAGDVFRLMDDTNYLDAGANIVPSLKTAHLRPFGENGRGQVEWIEIFTSEAQPFTGTTYIDEEVNITDPDHKGEQFTFTAIAAQYQSAKGKKLIWKPTHPVIFNALQLEIGFPSTTALIEVEKIIIAVRAVVPTEETEAVP